MSVGRLPSQMINWNKIIENRRNGKDCIIERNIQKQKREHNEMDAVLVKMSSVFFLLPHLLNTIWIHNTRGLQPAD